MNVTILFEHGHILFLFNSDLDDNVEDLENSNVDILARLTALEEANNVLQSTVQTLEDENILLRCSSIIL